MYVSIRTKRYVHEQKTISNTIDNFYIKLKKPVSLTLYLGSFQKASRG